MNQAVVPLTPPPTLVRDEFCKEVYKSPFPVQSARVKCFAFVVAKLVIG